MIRTRVDLYGIEESFTRPVLVTMVRNINTLLGIKRNIYVRFDNKESVIKSKTNMPILDLDDNYINVIRNKLNNIVVGQSSSIEKLILKKSLKYPLCQLLLLMVKNL